MTKCEIDVIRRVYVEGERGIYLEVAPWAEVPDDYLAIYVNGQKNVEWFGEFNPWSMTPDFARALGEALIACANDMEAKR